MIVRAALAGPSEFEGKELAGYGQEVSLHASDNIDRSLVTESGFKIASQQMLYGLDADRSAAGFMIAHEAAPNARFLILSPSLP